MAQFRKLEIDCDFRSYVSVGRWFSFQLTTVDDLGQAVALREASALTLNVAGPHDVAPEFCTKTWHRDESTVRVRFSRECSVPLRISAACGGCLSVTSHAFTVCRENVLNSLPRRDSYSAKSLDPLPQRHFAFDGAEGTGRICISVGEDPRSSLVGAHAWEASIALALYFASCSELELCGSERCGQSDDSTSKVRVGNIRAIEVGCGATALVGMVIGTRGVRTIVTDRERNLLDLAQLNVDANGLGGSVECRVLSWGAETTLPLLASGNAFGLIVAADVVYCEDAYVALVETLTALCAESSAVVMAYKKRDETSEVHFFHMMSVGFDMSVISTQAGPSGTCEIIRFSRKSQEALLSCQYCQFLQSRPGCKGEICRFYSRA
jgi:hypothetical protein